MPAAPPVETATHFLVQAVGAYRVLTSPGALHTAPRTSDSGALAHLDMSVIASSKVMAVCDGFRLRVHLQTHPLRTDTT